jgi:hypothetical protein
VLTLAENLKRHRSPERAAFEDAIEEQERAAQLAPIITAQAAQNQRLAAIQEAEKEEIAAGRKDPGFAIPESVAGKSMNLEQATKFSIRGAQDFYRSCEQFRAFFDLAENKTAICNFLDVQGIRIADAECFRLAFERLRDLGLLTEKQSVPEPEPVIVSEPEADPEAERKRAYYEDAIHSDPLTGEKFTEYQLDHDPTITADRYRRIMRIPRAPNTYRPAVGDVLATNRQ